MKLFDIRKVMVLVSVSIHQARISRTRWFEGLFKVKIKKIYIILETIKSNELSLVFSKIVSKGLCCDKVWGISIFSSCTPIRGIYRKSPLILGNLSSIVNGPLLKSHNFVYYAASVVVLKCLCISPKRVPSSCLNSA